MSRDEPWRSSPGNCISRHRGVLTSAPPGATHSVSRLLRAKPNGVFQVATIDTVKSLLGDVLNIDSRAQSLTRESALLGSIPELDSMAVVGLISALEDQFGIMIEDDEMDASIFASVGSLVDFVDGKLAS